MSFLIGFLHASKAGEIASSGSIRFPDSDTLIVITLPPEGRGHGQTDHNRALATVRLEVRLAVRQSLP